MVDDHAMFRAGIRSEIADRVWILGDAGSVGEAIDGIVQTQPQVVLLDVQLRERLTHAFVLMRGVLEGVTQRRRGIRGGKHLAAHRLDV